MMANDRRELGSSAVQSHLRNTQSTHNKAAEASAARLLKLLRLAYPTIQGRELTEGSVSNETTLADITSAQGSLIDYLDAKIAGRDEDVGAIRANPHIAATIQLIDAICANQTLSFDSKKKIWTQMKSIASTCPGIDWDANHARWSTNHIYNPSTTANDLVIASPAETMNLVCAAIFDKHRYATEDATDLGFRIESFYSRLLNLQTQEEAGQYQLCAAGRQHEMLFLLNMSYLEKPRHEDLASPIQLIEDTGAFLVNSLSSYIESELSSVSPEIRGRVVLDSMRSQSNLIEMSEYPLITWLNEKHASHWKDDCMTYLSKRCIDFGINPSQCKLADIIAGLEYLPLPASGQMLEPMMAEIFRAEPFVVREPRGGGVAARIDDWDTLVSAANAALEIIKFTITLETCESQAQVIRDFYKSLELMKSLNRYKNLSVFVGTEEGAFNHARDDLQNALIPYFSDFNLTRRLSSEFEGPLQRYLIQEKAFNQGSQVEYVENSFMSLFAGLDFRAWWDRLQALRPADAEKHPLELSDEVLESWYRGAVVAGAEGEPPTMDVSPYQINRILLHALLVMPNQWSPRYVESLRLVTDWLLQPKKPGEGLLNTLKESYPGPVLSNLLLLSLLNRPSFSQDGVKRRLNHLSENKHALFTQQDFLETLIQQNTMEETTAMFSAIQGQLGHYIRNSDHLIDFLRTDRLNDEHINQILSFVGEGLGGIIKNKYDLRILFYLPESQLNAEHRTQIFRALDGRLGELFENGYDLSCLLNLPESQLNAKHRTQIFRALDGQWGALIKNVADLTPLLSLPESQLNAEYRTQILSAFKERWSELIKDRMELRALLDLPESQLNAKHRTLIWRALDGRWGELIKHLGDLIHLLDRPESQLNAEYRNQIFRGLDGQLGKSFVMSGYELKYLLDLPESLFNAEHRTQILRGLKGQWGELIRTGADLTTLLNLPPSQLNAEYRTQIFRELNDRWGELIKNGANPIFLLSLPELHLNAEHRTQIFTALEGQWGALIKNRYDLSLLLSLPESHLNAEHRTLIWRALKGRLGGLIPEGYDDRGAQLISLLSAAQLNAEHRTLILPDVFKCLSTFSLDDKMRRTILALIFPDRPIPIRHFIQLLKIRPSDADMLSREMKITKEDVVAYIRGLNAREKVFLIKQIFDERNDTGLHAFFASQRGYTQPAENQGMLKELAEMIVPSLRDLGFFSRTAQAYHDAVLAIPDPEPTRGAPGHDA